MVREDIKLKKFLSFLAFIITCALIAGLVYLFPNFFEHQLNKIQGIYYVHKGDKAYRKMKLQKSIIYVCYFTTQILFLSCIF